MRLQLAVKRLIDLVIASAALMLCAPLLAAIALAIKLESPRVPMFFNDTVMGLGESRFTMLKFRTMIPHEINYGDRREVTAGSPLVTRVGAVLRRWKLDELPQFWNVLRGQMSLVGPRQMDPVRFDRATDFQRQRLLMRPGLTGWVQVNGSIQWSWEQRMEMDIWYVGHWSLALDARILCRTVPTILFGERRNADAERVTDRSCRVWWPGADRHGQRS